MNTEAHISTKSLNVVLHPLQCKKGILECNIPSWRHHICLKVSFQHIHLSSYCTGMVH